MLALKGQKPEIGPISGPFLGLWVDICPPLGASGVTPKSGPSAPFPGTRWALSQLPRSCYGWGHWLLIPPSVRPTHGHVIVHLRPRSLSHSPIRLGLSSSAGLPCFVYSREPRRHDISRARENFDSQSRRCTLWVLQGPHCPDFGPFLRKLEAQWRRPWRVRATSCCWGSTVRPR